MIALVIGYGSIGKRHAENLKKLGIDVVLYRSKTGPHSGFKEYYDLDEALKIADIVLITNPTSLHLQTAMKVAEAGKPMFIEKPLSHNLDDVDKFLKLVKKKEIPVMIGYNMRFHPALKRIKQLVEKKTVGKVLTANVSVGSYLPDWHPKQDYRTSYSSSSALGGGVLLDLSHEIDTALWLFGKAHYVSSVLGKVSNLSVDVEDVANLILEMKNDVVVEIHMDYLQKPAERSIEILCSEGTIKWSSNDNIVRMFYAKTDEWLSSPLDKFDNNHMYVEEVQHFIDCVKSSVKPIISEVDGKAVLDIVTAAKLSAKSGKVVEV